MRLADLRPYLSLVRLMVGRVMRVMRVVRVRVVHPVIVRGDVLVRMLARERVRGVRVGGREVRRGRARAGANGVQRVEAAGLKRRERGEV